MAEATVEAIEAEVAQVSPLLERARTEIARVLVGQRYMVDRLLIGLIEVFWAAYFSSEYKDVAAFAILVLVLIFRPTGLLGKPEIEKV